MIFIKKASIPFNKYILPLTAASVAGAYAFFYLQNHMVDCTSYDIVNHRLPKAFNGTKILQISDFHNANLNKQLMKKIHTISPDYIFITGDFIDKRRTKESNIHIAIDFIKDLVKIAPVYYAPGNHEPVSKVNNLLQKALRNNRVHILNNQTEILAKDNMQIKVTGIQDVAAYGNNKHIPKNYAHKLINDTKNQFNILLAHRPHLIKDYLSCGADLIFSGHAHGGQVRLPFIGGLYAPQQGVFPKLINGMHHYGPTTLIISRGIGNSKGPVRIFNHPELVVVTLHQK